MSDYTPGELHRDIEHLERDLQHFSTAFSVDMDKHEMDHVSMEAFKAMQSQLNRYESLINRLLLAVIGEILVVGGLVVAALIIKGLA